MNKRLFLTLAVMIFAGVLLFPMTVFAEEGAGDTAAEESVSGIPPYDGPSHITPDGSGTVIDNVFIEGSGLEFFTFSTEDGNIFYLVIDRMRTRDNVYFLNAVTEQDLMSLAQKDSGRSGSSTSGIPSTPNPGGSGASNQSSEKEQPDNPPANKSGNNNGMLIFILLGVVAVGGAAYYFKIVRPKKQPKDDDDDEGMDDEDDYDGEDEDDEDEYLSRTKNEDDSDEME